MAREKHGLTQVELAEELGTSQQRINKLESGITKTCKEKFVIEAAKTLEVSPAWLALGEEYLDDMSEQALLVAKRYDRLSPDVRNRILAILLDVDEQNGNTNHTK